MVSTNASGAKSYLYGPMRSHVAGLRVLLADGRSVSLQRGEQFAHDGAFSLSLEDGSFIKGKLPSYRMPRVKNASGYYITPDMDLLDRFLGGRHAWIVTEITIALSPGSAELWILTFFETMHTRFCTSRRLKRLEGNRNRRHRVFDRAFMSDPPRAGGKRNAHQGALAAGAEAVSTGVPQRGSGRV
jgi:FAD/FMN-containing dehydrogenase